MHTLALRPNHEKTGSRPLPAAPRGQECLCDGRGIARAERVLWEVSHSYKPQETKGGTLPAAIQTPLQSPEKSFLPNTEALQL